MDTYEKKYKEALERAEKALEVFGTDKCEGARQIFSLFPELKESEDERIRKELITHCRNTRCVTEEGAEKIAKWIAWLEKQGEKKPIWHNEDEEPQRGSLILLIMQSGTPIVAKIIEPNHTFNHGERWAYIDDLLEKKGEQNPTDLEEFISELSKQFPDVSFAKLSRIAVRVAKWAKPTDKEMKELLRTEYEKGMADAIAERQKSAWSEESINKPNGKIVMEDFNDGNGFYKVNIAYLNEEQVEEIEELVKRWDLQSKGNEEDSIINDLLDYFDEDKCLKHEVNDIVKWLKTIKPQQKGWGENEIKMLDNLITYLDGRKDLLEEIKRTYIDWLKSLKDRCTWKPSEEQLDALKRTQTGVIQFSVLQNLYNDLKKLSQS